MSSQDKEVGQRERETQKRIVKLFRDELHYDYLGDWEERSDNSNIEEDLLKKHLSKQGYADSLIRRAIEKLKLASNNYSETLYTNNKNNAKLF